MSVRTYNKHMDTTNTTEIARRALKLCELALSAEKTGSTEEAMSAGYQAGRHIWMTGLDIERWLAIYPECRRLFTERDPADPDQYLGLAFHRLVDGWHDMETAVAAARSTPAN